MSELKRPIDASKAPVRMKPSNYPEPFASRMGGREKRPLGDLFGLTNFGVNLTTLDPGAVSALHHRHSSQDEFVYVVSGTLTLVTDDGEFTLEAGMVIGFPAGGTAHHLHNRSGSAATYIEIGDRTAGDACTYPNDDLQAVHTETGWFFARKDGTPY